MRRWSAALYEEPVLPLDVVYFSRGTGKRKPVGDHQGALFLLPVQLEINPPDDGTAEVQSKTPARGVANRRQRGKRRHVRHLHGEKTKTGGRRIYGESAVHLYRSGNTRNTERVQVEAIDRLHAGYPAGRPGSWGVPGHRCQGVHLQSGSGKASRRQRGKPRQPAKKRREAGRLAMDKAFKTDAARQATAGRPLLREPYTCCAACAKGL